MPFSNHHFINIALPKLFTADSIWSISHSFRTQNQCTLQYYFTYVVLKNHLKWSSASWFYYRSYGLAALPRAQMEDSWQEALRALESKRYGEARDRWRQVMMAAGQAAFTQGTGMQGPGRIRLHTYPILDSQDSERIETLSAHNGFVIYDRAVVPVGAAPAVAFFRPLAAFFNLALSFHLHGFANSNSGDQLFPRTPLLKRASQLYAICLGVIQDAFQNAGADHHALLLLLMACYNNHGHLQSHFCVQEEAEHDMTRILVALTGLLGNEQDTDPHSVHSMDINGIFAHDLSFFAFFRFVPTCMILCRLPAAA